MLRLAIMVSGNGSLMQHIYDAINNKQIDASIEAVIYSKECKAQQTAESLGTPCFLYDEKLESLLDEHEVGLVILAGFTRRLKVPASYQGRIINVHPSLLPKFGGKGMYGMRVHEKILEAGETVSGCTVHLVNDEYDSGDILFQKTCPVLPQDTAADLRQRVFELEKELLTEAVRSFQD